MAGRTVAATMRSRSGPRTRAPNDADALYGEAFALLATNTQLTTAVQLDLRLIEAEQVASPGVSNQLGPDESDGIQYDAAGNPIRYHIWPEHPGGAITQSDEALVAGSATFTTTGDAVTLTQADNDFTSVHVDTTGAHIT